jgi:V/A-type H+-transporting ATPase subunit I
MEQTKSRIKELEDEIGELSKVLTDKRDEVRQLLNKIYTTVSLERKIAGLIKEVYFGESTFVINAWIRDSDKAVVNKALQPLMQRIMIEEKKAEEMEKQVTPPTQLKNNKFVKPFEAIIRLYGVPSYYEIDPTPFLAITYCLMFGIMFGDIGQGLVYFIAGCILQKKRRSLGQILQRLGGSSIIFGFVYGSLFGLEQEQLPWLPSLIGKPLDPKNIPSILIAGVVFGVVVMSVSFILGVINSVRIGNLEMGIFGKNGLAGYIFYMSLIGTAVAVTGVIRIPLIIPILTLVLSLLVMIMKEPLTSLVTKKRPLVHGTFGNYMTESIFEGVETILGTLSNAISFIRVGAFALNHAGLFLAFMVMSELMPNIALKILVLVLGNILILSLEGLVVFIQGLRLQYYEMFGKYFQGEGTVFKPIKISN